MVFQINPEYCVAVDESILRFVRTTLSTCYYVPCLPFAIMDTLQRFSLRCYLPSTAPPRRFKIVILLSPLIVGKPSGSVHSNQLGLGQEMGVMCIDTTVTAEAA